MDGRMRISNANANLLFGIHTLFPGWLQFD